MSAAHRSCIDSSVAIAGFGPWHEFHEPAVAVLADRPALIAHAALETYSVLARLPEPFRAPAPLVIDYLSANFADRRLTLPADAQRRLPELMQEGGIRGGAVYDGLVALTAKRAGAELLSLDSRAAETYARLEIDYRLLL